MRKIAQLVAKVRSNDKAKRWMLFGLTLVIFPVWLLFIAFLMPVSLRPTLITFQLKIFVIASVVGATCLTFPKAAQFLSALPARLKSFDEGLSQSQQLYRSVIVLGASLTALVWLGVGELSAPLLWIFVAFCIFVALFDVFRWYKSLSEHAAGKALFGIGFAFASTLAYAIARQEIAQATHVTPTNLTHTTLLVAIMTIPMLIVLASGAAYLICMVASTLILPFFFLFRDAPSGIKKWLFADVIKDQPLKYPVSTRLFQVFFYGTLGLFFVHVGGNSMPRYESLLQEVLPRIVYEFDLYRGSECKLLADEKLAPLGDSKFLIGKKAPSGTIEFNPPVKCEDLAAR